MGQVVVAAPVGSPVYLAIIDAIGKGEESRAKGLLGLASSEYYLTEGANSSLTDGEFDEACKAYRNKFGRVFRVNRVAPGTSGAAGSEEWPVTALAPVNANTEHAAAYVARPDVSEATTARKNSNVKARKDRQAGFQQDFPLLANFLDEDLRTVSQMRSWIGEVSSPTSTYVCSPKYDGMSVTITYTPDGRIVRALTRGDDGLGVDVTRLFEGEQHYEGVLIDGESFGVKYEAVMTWADVELMSEALGKTYKNPRGTVAGLISSDKSRERRAFILLAPLDIEYDGMPQDRLERLTEFEEAMLPGFKANGEKETPWEWTVCETADEVETYYGQVIDGRSQRSLMLDGIVIELHQAADIERLGGRSTSPQWAAKMKFPYMVESTRAISLDWDLGNTGRRTPVVNFEPVVLNGATYSRTSIANVTRFDELQLCPGTPLMFVLRNDVLGWLDRGGDDPEGAEPFPDPEGVEFTYNDDGRRVFAYEEAPLAGRVERMVVKMGIKGVRIQQITKLTEAGLITCLGDAFRLMRTKVARVPGFGESSAELLCSAMDEKASAGLHDWEVLASLGIVGVGRTVGKQALEEVTLSEILGAAVDDGDAVGYTITASGLLLADEDDAVIMMSPATAAMAERLMSVPNIGPGRALTILGGVAKHSADLEDLVKMHRVSQTKGVAAAAAATGRSLYKVVVTGDLNGWADRGTFKTLIESMGHKMVGSMSGKVDFLITNSTNRTGKYKEARDLGVEILSEAEAIDRLGLEAPPPKAGSAPVPAASLSEF